MMNHKIATVLMVGSLGVGVRGLERDTERCCETAAGSQCAVPEISSREQRHALRHRIRDRDTSALVGAFLVRSRMDGGELEDLDRAMAQALDASPHDFLQAAYLSCAPIQAISAVVVKLPLEVVDDRQAAVSILKSRLTVLEKVDVERHRDYSRGAIDAIEAALSIIERADR